MGRSEGLLRTLAPEGNLQAVRGTRVLAGVVLTTLLLVSCDSGEQASNEGRIAFTSRRDGWFSIYTVRPDGTDLSRLVDIVEVENAGPGNYLDVLGQPAWSADGTRLAFVCPVEGRSGLCVADADGSNTEVLPIEAGEQDRLPGWSPDDRIAFARLFDNERSGIYVTDSEGAEVRELTSGHFDFNPRWSPNGDEIAFIRRTGDRYDIWVVSEDGSSVQMLKRTEGAEGMIAWAPNGSQLAHVIGEPHQDVHVTSLDTLRTRNVTQTDYPENWPTWSPDGKRLAFICGPRSSICVMNADGSGRELIVSGADLNMHPAWQWTTAEPNSQ